MQRLKAIWQRYSHPSDEERELREQFGRLLESLNRVLLLASLLAFYLLLIPILYKVEQSTTKTANDIQSIKERLTETEQAVRNEIGVEAWNKASEYLKQR